MSRDISRAKIERAKLQALAIAIVLAFGFAGWLLSIHVPNDVANLRVLQEISLKILASMAAGTILYALIKRLLIGQLR